MKRHRVLQADRIEIVDQKDRPRLILSVHDDGCPFLRMIDSRGQIRATLILGKSGEPELAFGRNERDLQLMLYVDGEGGSRIHLRQIDLDKHVVLRNVPEPMIQLIHESGQLVLRPPSEGEVGINRKPPELGESDAPR